MRGLVVVLVLVVSVRAFAQAEPPEPAPQTPPPTEPAPPTPPPTEASVPVLPPDATPPPRKFPDGWRLMLSDLTILRLNPIGLESRGRFGLQKKLYPSTAKVTENNFAFVGVYPKLNPASASLGLGGELQPASIFNLRVVGEVQQFFGALGFLQSFASPNVNYADDRLADNRDNPTPATEAQAAAAFHVSVQPMLQLKVGKIALRALLQLDYWNFDLRDGDTAAYEATFDTLLPDGGWSVSTDTDLLYVTDVGLAAGLRHSWVRPLYGDEHFVDAADRAAYDGDNAHHRLGLFGAYTLRDHGPSRFNKPTLVLIVSWYLAHKYRAGEPDTLQPDHAAGDYRSRAIPYFLAGFAFESDFLPVR